MMRAGTLGLSALALLLAAGIAVQWQAAPTETVVPRAAVPAARPGGGGPGTPDENLRAAWLTAALERPLFTASRHPPARAPAVPQAGPAALPRLAGVLAGPFGRRAIFAAPEGGKPLVVGEGDSIGGYRVRAIADGAVTLESADRVLRLRPSFATATGPVASATPPDLPSGLPPGILPEDIANTPPTPGRRP